MYPNPDTFDNAEQASGRHGNRTVRSVYSEVAPRIVQAVASGKNINIRLTPPAASRRSSMKVPYLRGISSKHAAVVYLYFDPEN